MVSLKGSCPLKKHAIPLPHHGAQLQPACSVLCTRRRTAMERIRLSGLDLPKSLGFVSDIGSPNPCAWVAFRGCIRGGLLGVPQSLSLTWPKKSKSFQFPFFCVAGWVAWSTSRTGLYGLGVPKKWVGCFWRCGAREKQSHQRVITRMHGHRKGPCGSNQQDFICGGC